MQSLQSWITLFQENYLPPGGHAGKLFTAHLERIWSQTDQLFYYLLLLQYPVAIAFAVWWSPLAWSGATSSIHFHVWIAVLFGGLLTSLPVYLIRTAPAAGLTRHVVAIAQMLMGSLLIHLSGGRIETHFHIFGSLAFLAFYRDIRVLATASLIVILDHFLRGVFVSESIYGTVSGASWRFVEHGLWVLFEDIFLALACITGRAQISEMAQQQAQLEDLNQTIEDAVRARTHELSVRTEELAAARDAAMESTRLKGQFLANVSHEIRTPMNGVLGMTGLLLESELTGEQRDFALTVRRSGEALLTIINDLLDLSKIEAGKLVLERVDFILPNEIEDVAQLLADQAERKKLELVCEIEPDIPLVVTGDAGRLRQILINLVGNAIKFTDEGHVILRASLREQNGERSCVRFEVTDTGVGITEQAQKSLFQAFVQVDGSNTRRHEGTGLGLAISKQIVQLMGGQLGLTSAFGAGSTFWFEIPLSVVAASDANDVQWHSLEGLRVLIVDDNATNRQVTRRMVESWGMSSEEAPNAQRGIVLLEQAFRSERPFDVALLDLQMPEMDGIQLARAIRQRPYLRPLQLLLLTSLGQRAVCKSLEQIGIGACLVKPIRREHLFLTMAKLCKSLPSLEVALHETPVPKQENEVHSLTKTLSILVAEDNLINQRVLTRMLERLGHTYEVVTDGRAAVAAVRRSAFDVVLMDCQMPVMDGFEAAARIRQLGGRAAQTSILAVTANSMSGDRERCLAAGMDGYIAKPIQLYELTTLLAGVQPDAERELLCAS